MGTGPQVALPLLVVLAVGAALLARRAKAIAVVLGVAGFVVVPWLAGETPIVRGVLALLGGVTLLRVIDLARSRETWGAGRRLLHVISLVDTRTIRRGPRQLDLRAIGRALAWGAVAVAGM